MKTDKQFIDEIYKKYDEYQKAVADIIRVSNSNVSRNGFDHLLWYYHKGRIWKSVHFQTVLLYKWVR